MFVSSEQFIEANLGTENDGSFRWDLHPDLRADYLLANPPLTAYFSDWSPITSKSPSARLGSAPTTRRSLIGKLARNRKLTGRLVRAGSARPAGDGLAGSARELEGCIASGVSGKELRTDTFRSRVAGSSPPERDSVTPLSTALPNLRLESCRSLHPARIPVPRHSGTTSFRSALVSARPVAHTHGPAGQPLNSQFDGRLSSGALAWRSTPMSPGFNGLSTHRYC